MTLARYQSCAKPGCPNIVDKGLCPEHRRKARRETDKRTGRVRGSKWSALRRRVLARDMLCQDGRVCNHKNTSVEVDHIIPLVDGGHPTEMSNLQGICCACHRAKTGAEQQQQNDYRRKLNGG